MEWLGFLVVFALPLVLMAFVARRVIAFARFAAEARRRVESAGSGVDVGGAPETGLPPFLEALLRLAVEAKTRQLAAASPELREALERARATSPVAPPAIDRPGEGQERRLRWGLLALVGAALGLLARAL